MASNPEITITLPTFNAQLYLKQAIDSVLSQSFENFELIITDDCSTDATEEIVRSYKDERLKFFRNERNLGALRNYNFAFSMCRGSLIKPFAQDDVLQENHLELLRAVLKEQKNVSLVACARRIICGGTVESVESSFDHSGIYSGRETQKECIRRFVYLFNLIGEPCCAMFRREHLAEGWDVNYYHMTDLDMWIRILGFGDLYYIAEPLCSYRKHEMTQTSNNLKSMYYMLDFFRILDKHKPIAEEVFGSIQEAYLQVIDHMGRFVSGVTDSQRADVSTISLSLLDSRDPIRIQSGIEFENSSRPTTLNDQEYFRQIAFFALLKLGHTSKILDETYKQLQAREQELKNVYESRTWKATNVLRRLSRSLLRSKTT